MKLLRLLFLTLRFFVWLVVLPLRIMFALVVAVLGAVATGAWLADEL